MGLFSTISSWSDFKVVDLFLDTVPSHIAPQL